MTGPSLPEALQMLIDDWESKSISDRNGVLSASAHTIAHQADALDSLIGYVALERGVTEAKVISDYGLGNLLATAVPGRSTLPPEPGAL